MTRRLFDRSGCNAAPGGRVGGWMLVLIFSARGLVRPSVPEVAPTATAKEADEQGARPAAPIALSPVERGRRPGEPRKNDVNNTLSSVDRGRHPGEPRKNDVNNTAVFFHIPKTGGSSARCMLRMELREQICQEDEVLVETFKDEALGSGGGLAVRENTVAVVHLATMFISDGVNERVRIPKGSGRYYPWTHFQNAIVSIRDPVERVVSWYLYTRQFGEGEKTELEKFILGPECHGHATTRGFFSSVAEGARLEQVNKTGTKCQKAAVKCIRGEKHLGDKCGRVLTYDYAFHLRDLLDGGRGGPEDPPPLPIFAIRNERKWQDFATTNLIMGGSLRSFDPETLKNVKLRKSHEDRSVDDGDREFLCTLLCEDLYYYSKVLRLAENLHPSEKARAIGLMSESCHVADVTSLCPAYNFTF